MNNKFLTIACVSLSVLSSCEKADFGMNASSEKDGELTVYTRSIDGEELQYPLAVYAFNDNGQCTGKQTITDAATSLSLKLPAGSHTIVALGGTDACEIPSSPRLNSFLSLLDDAETPLQMGRANVEMGDGNAKAYLQMRYLVCDVNVSLSGLPEDVTSVSMSLSKPYSQWSFSGIGGNPYTFTKELSEGSLPGMWESNHVYVLPTEGTATLTLSLTSSEGTTSYAYTCPEALKSGVPYILSGSYSANGLQVDGVFSAEGWADPVEWSFSFGPGVSPDDQPSPQDRPRAGELWNGHIVASVKDLNASQWQVCLLSKAEAEEMPSALSTDDDPEAASKYAAVYTEDGLSQWHIPTKEEAQMLQSNLGGDNLISLNELLTQEGLPVFLDYEPGSSTEKARYLCDDAKKTFSMAGTIAPSAAGKVKKYRLRLVKDILIDK